MQMSDGTFTQYLTVSLSDPIARIPVQWSYTQAAAVPLVALTAFACLDWLPLRNEKDDKRRVIVSGASGGVGIWCVQLAKRLYDCHIIGVCSGSNADFVRHLGADEIVDYEKVDVATSLLEGRTEDRRYDLFIDCVGGVDMFQHWVRLLGRAIQRC
jgi:NADPH:quinone reductase-like Zn-dependent oxidoreductase